MSSPPFFLRDSRASQARTRVKITPREKSETIFTRARVSLALLSLRTNGGLLLVYASRGFSLAWLLAFTKSFAWLVCRVKAMQERNLCLQGKTGKSKLKSVNTAEKNALISVKLRSLKVIC